MKRPNNRVALENDRPRVETRDKVTGRARFTADVQLPEMIHARFIRFPLGAGRVVKADLAAARAVKGVLEVELDVDKRGRYPGERLGHVVAASIDALEDAFEALALEVEVKGVKAVPPTTVPVPEQGAAKLKRLFGRAARVVEATYTTQVQTHSALETHGGVVTYSGARAEAWASTQGTFAWRDGLERPLGIDASKIVVHCEHVGGGFGAKFGPGAEGTLAARLAKKYGRPCKAMLTREEEHLDAGNRPGSVQYMKIGVNAEGKILGGRVHAAGVVGFEDGGGDVKNPVYYDFGEVERSEAEVTLSSGRPRAFRAPGHPQGGFAVESMIDELAAAVGFDPIEVRLLNETSDRRREQLQRGAELIGWSRRRPDGSWPGRLKRGFGCGATGWYSWPTPCAVEVELSRDGRVAVRSGVQDIGTGTRTVLADLAAAKLKVPRDRIDVSLGDSRLPRGPGSGGSVVSRAVAPALHQACDRVLARLRRATGGKELSWEESCKRLPAGGVKARGKTITGVEGSGTSDGVQFAEVEVDVETGQVRVVHIVAIQACGKVINRQTAENQVAGGVIQGLSYALLEERRLDRRTGGVVGANLEQYAIAGAGEVPDLTIVLDGRPEDTGVRSLGEPPTIPTAGAIANAVANAIGARVRDLPITAARVLAALAASGGGR